MPIYNFCATRSFALRERGLTAFFLLYCGTTGCGVINFDAC
jgi:hypothetical protein